MLGGLVGGRGDGRDSVAVGVVDGPARQRGVVERPQRLLNDLHVVVGGVKRRLGEVVDVGDKAVADPQWQDHAVGTGAEVAAVVRLRARVKCLAGAVAVLDVVEWVVVVVEEVPAGDVVDIAVVVAVGPVGEGDDQVLGREHGWDFVVGIRLGDIPVVRIRRAHGGSCAARIGQNEDALGDRRGDAAVARVVAQVEDAVAVGVVLALVGRAVRAAYERGRGRVVRNRELVLIQVDLEPHVVHRPAVLPPDSRVEDRYLDVGAPGGDGPRGVLRGVGVDDEPAADAEVLVGLVVDRDVAGLGGRRVLPVIAA